MNRIIAIINGINEWVGRFVGILTLILAVVMLAIVVLRYGFSMSSVWLSESVMYLHGMIFMLGAAYTLKHNGHVRVDIFQRRY
ncbi:MAG TPA: TRAP transporter small permease subunit, partial [Halothiobacillus sp.]|nr:TRAP transporter small permease subunit [Halothiobacillus sp.]